MSGDFGGSGPLAEPAADDLVLARWEVATLTGRLRSVEDERDAARRERDRTNDLVRALRRSRSYRIGRLLDDFARDPWRTVRRLLRGRRPPAATPSAPVAARLPARVYVAVGITGETAVDLVKALRQRIVVDADHLPVLVTDQPSVRDLRVPGVVIEYLPDQATWSRHEPAGGWEALLAGRIAHLCRSYGVVRADVIDPRDPPSLARLLAP